MNHKQYLTEEEVQVLRDRIGSEVLRILSKAAGAAISQQANALLNESLTEESDQFRVCLSKAKYDGAREHNQRLLRILNELVKTD